MGRELGRTQRMNYFIQEEGLRDDARNFPLGLISFLILTGSTGCVSHRCPPPHIVELRKKLGLPDDFNLFDKIRPSVLDRLPKNHKIWQENGGKYNRLVIETLIEGIHDPGHLQNIHDPSAGDAYITALHAAKRWAQQAERYWNEEGRDIMEQHLKDGHPSAILWDQTGRKFELDVKSLY